MPPTGGGCGAIFTKTSRLLADLAGGHADRSWEARLRRRARPALVDPDDFAMRDFTATRSDDLYELVTERTRRSMVITANRAATEWYRLFLNPVVAESILDRVVNGAHHVRMPRRSYITPDGVGDLRGGLLARAHFNDGKSLQIGRGGGRGNGRVHATTPSR